MEAPSTSSVPANWENNAQWLRNLVETDGEASQNTFAEALLAQTESNNFIVHRLGTPIKVGMFSKEWDKFSSFFGGKQYAIAVLNTVDTLRTTNETRAIRTLDLFFDSMASNLQLTGISEVLTDFSDKDWKTLTNELIDPNSIFLSDEEMKKLNESPRSSDPSQRPTRFLVGALYSGRAEIDSVKGNLESSINYCKEKYLK